MNYQINGRVYHKNGEEKDVVVTVAADNLEQAKHYFSGGISIDEFPESTVKVDLRTLKESNDD